MELDEFKIYMTPFFKLLDNVSKKVDDVIHDVGEIKVQTTKTNGRVSTLEGYRVDEKEDKKFSKDKNWQLGGIVLTIILSSIATLLLTFFIAHFK